MLSEIDSVFGIFLSACSVKDEGTNMYEDHTNKIQRNQHVPSHISGSK